MPDAHDGADSQPGHPGWLRFVEAPLIACGALAIFAMMFLSVTDAVLRSFFDRPIFGANDYTQIILSIAVSISMPLCVLSGRVIAIDTLITRLPDSLYRIVAWVVTLAGVVMLGYLAWRAFLNGQEAARFAETTLLLQLPLGISYYAIAAGAALSCVLLIVERIRDER